MDDATPSAPPMPEQPLATATNPAAPFPPADSSPVFVPPSVTDPVSNLDFLPVDDAFALEMRSETIEQLVGDDALRRGESERIEAGRSKTNADLVAGRDRVRVQDTLHEHTGHARAEQAAHLHTTVEGVLDVHATSEDTVLLAGHMRELWDGGAAIVAAMTDDTVGGGGIRVTTPLDLWVHGLMGVEERIGTCTADAVLLELGATHYEREYGPGAHAAGLAVYAGSLYQSSRSTFRALMRVSSGVRNLIAGGGGEGGGGDAGAGDAPTASTPPASAAGDAGDAGPQAASKTLCAATGAGGTAQAGGMAGGRSENLTGIHPGDEVAALALGANVPGACGDLTELRRGEDTAGQLEALRDATCGGEAGTQGEATSVSRFPKLDDTASVHEASALDIEAVVRPVATVPDLDAPVLPSTVSPPQPPPGVQLRLLGGADRPPQPAAPESDFHTVYRRLREFRSYYYSRYMMGIENDFFNALQRVEYRIRRQFRNFNGSEAELANLSPGVTLADQTYRVLQKMARDAKNEGASSRTDQILEALKALEGYTAAQLQALYKKYNITEDLIAEAATNRVTTPVFVPPADHTINQSNWISAYRQLRSLDRRFSKLGWKSGVADIHSGAKCLIRAVARRFTNLGGTITDLSSFPIDLPRPEQRFQAMLDMLTRAEETENAPRVREIHRELEVLYKLSSKAWDNLTRKYGALDDLASSAGQSPMQLSSATDVPTTLGAPPVTTGPPVSVPPMTVPPPVQLNVPVTQHPIAVVENLAYLESAAGSLVHTTGVPGPPLASGLPGPSLAEATAEAGDLGRWRLGPPTTANTAAQPVAMETIVTPGLDETTALWLQPPGLWPGAVPFDSGPHHAGETVPPPPVATAAGRLPIQTSDVPVEGFRAADEGGGNPAFIEQLDSLEESDEGALLDAYPQRVDPQWLDNMQEMPGLYDDPAAPSAASTTDFAKIDAAEIDRILGTGEGVSHLAPLPPPSAPWRAGAGAWAPPPAAGQWPIRPPAMNGAPHPVAFDPWSAPPGPSSQARYTETILPPVMSAGAPPGWQGAATPGFARAASGAVELPFSHRAAIALQFGTEDALRMAEVALRTRHAEALGGFAPQWPAVLADLHWLHAVARWDSAAYAAGLNVDWLALEALARFLQLPPPLP